MRKWHKLLLFFYKFYNKVLGKVLFRTSGENNENVLVKICKGLVYWKKICKGIFFMLFQGSIFDI